MANGTAALRKALERFDQADRVDGLVSALGLDACRYPLESDLLQAVLPAGLDGPLVARTVAARGSLVLLLFVFEGPVRTAALAELCRRVDLRDPTRQHLLLLCTACFDVVTLAVAGLDGEARHLTLERRLPRRTDLEALDEMVAGPDEGGAALALRYARALDRSRVTARFFRDFRAHRERVALAWLGVPPEGRADRMALALLFLCRVLFLYFLQRHRHLGGDPDFMAAQWRQWQREPRPGAGTFFRTSLDPLFFGVLNTRPLERGPDAVPFGDLPYLNGGLFERTARERAFPDIDLPDTAIANVFDDLFERYRFTAVEPADQTVLGPDASGVDPAMLGRVFEGLMSPQERGRTGTFFTPPRVVDQLVVGALDALLEARGPELEPRIGPGRTGPEAGRADDITWPLQLLRRIRVLDPACGSGAFLLGALARIASLRRALGDDPAGLRSKIVGESLHGVDLQADAALLCALRLWLALTVSPDPVHAGPVEPLPNLDRRVRQGDALLDPLDVRLPDAFALHPSLRVRLQRRILAIGPVARRYMDSEPGEREALQRELRQMEKRVARLWVEGWVAGAANRRRSLLQRNAQRDLWGNPTRDASVAQEELRRLEDRSLEIEQIEAALRDSGSLPFFSFPIHFPEAALQGFDLILMNPPWVRPHRWPTALRALARRRYDVCREKGWAAPAHAGRKPPGGQVDLAMLFLERAIGLLRRGGALGALLPAKTLRSLFAGPARRMLLGRLRLVQLEDYSLDHRALFEADAFAMTLVAVRQDGPSGGEGPGLGLDSERRRVHITMHRPGRAPLRFDMMPEDLPLMPGDPASPWLLAPAPVRNAMRRMQACGTPIGRIAGFRIRRGLETGANDVLIARNVIPGLGGLATIRAEGAYRTRSGSSGSSGSAGPAAFEAVIEDAALQPLVRGMDLDAWTFRAQRYLIRRRSSGPSNVAWPRVQQYLERHGARFSRRARRGAGKTGSAVKAGRHVAWHDLADTLRAVVMPPTVRTVFGDQRPPVALNTVYQVDVNDEREAYRLAAFLNSTPVRVFAATIAERAKDAHFRFFAWTVSVLPVPDALRDGRQARSLDRISRDAHAGHGITAEQQLRLDSIVTEAFGLTPSESEALVRFGHWLRGLAP